MEDERLTGGAKRCAIYVRNPRQRQQIGSTAAQIESCHAAAAARGWTVSEANLFADDGRDGYKAFQERPAMQAMLAAAQLDPRPFDVVVVEHQYRLNRSERDMLGVFSKLSRAGVPVLVVSPTAFNDSTDNGELEHGLDHGRELTAQESEL